MAIIGMDIEAVRQLAIQMDNHASQLDELMGALNTALSNTEWLGADRDRFNAEWNNTFMPQLTAVATSLRDNANVARSNADQQEQTSS